MTDYDYAADYQEWLRYRKKTRQLYLICGVMAACNVVLLVMLWC